MSRSGTRLEPGRRAASSVISMPNGKPSAASAQSIDETETINATAAMRTADVTEIMQSLENVPGVVLLDSCVIEQVRSPQKLRTKNPRGALTAGTSICSRSVYLPRTISVNG